ncbi:MAG: (2Fe-2S)-binding protein [Pseudomonadota bacterium]
MKDDELIICRCEEVTQADIKEVIRQGVTRMNEVKRLTRAGMGLCQGKTCGRLVTGIQASETGRPLYELKPSTFRPPTRVFPLSVLSSTPEDEAKPEERATSLRRK